MTKRLGSLFLFLALVGFMGAVPLATAQSLADFGGVGEGRGATILARDYSGAPYYFLSWRQYETDNGGGALRDLIVATTPRGTDGSQGLDIHTRTCQVSLFNGSAP
jgi:hypothetical protein